MGRADIGGRNREGTGSVAPSPQVVPHTGQPPPSPRRDVLDDDPFGCELADDAIELDPESGAGSGSDASAATGAADVLAGEAAADESNHGKLSCADRADIVEPLCVGPLFCEHALTERISLDLPRDGPPERALEPELKTADPREERADHWRARWSCET